MRSYTYVMEKYVEEELIVGLISNGILLPPDEVTARIEGLIRFMVNANRIKFVNGYRFRVKRTDTVKENLTLLADETPVLSICEEWSGDKDWKVMFINPTLLHPEIYRALTTDTRSAVQR